MKKKKILLSVLCGLLIFSVLTIAFASSGYFGTHGWYSSAYWTTGVPLINDEIVANSGCRTYYQGDSCIDNNYMYVRERIGASSSNYTQKTKSKACADNCGTIHAYWDKSHWAQTYHLATCYVHGTSENKTLNYSH